MQLNKKLEEILSLGRIIIEPTEENQKTNYYFPLIEGKNQIENFLNINNKEVFDYSGLKWKVAFFVYEACCGDFSNREEKLTYSEFIALGKPRLILKKSNYKIFNISDTRNH